MGDGALLQQVQRSGGSDGEHKISHVVSLTDYVRDPQEVRLVGLGHCTALPETLGIFPLSLSRSEAGEGTRTITSDQ